MLFDLYLILTIGLAQNFNVLFQFCIYFFCVIISVFKFYRFIVKKRFKIARILTANH